MNLMAFGPLPEIPMWVVYPILFIGFFISFVYLLIIFFKKDREMVKHIAKDIFFIIPIKNGAGHIEKCIKQLMTQNYDKKITILIVNDASTDNTEEICRDLARRYHSKDRRILIISKGKSTGNKASVLNFGLKYLFSKHKDELKNSLIAPLDSDTYLPSDTLETLVPHLGHEDVLAVTTWMLPANEKKFLAKMQKIEYLMTSFYRYLLGRIDAVCIAPAFTIFKAEAFKKIGYYDEKTLTEDFEMALRVNSFHYKIIFRDKPIKTDVPETFKSLKKQRVRWWYGTYQDVMKYRHLVSPKYGAIGTFFLPVTVILGTFIMLFAATLAIYSASFQVTNIVRELALGVIPRFELNIDFFTVSLFLSDPKIIMGLFALLLSILFLIYAANRVGEKVKLADYLIFVFVYGWLLILFCLEATIKYIFKLKTTW